jgi:hypothetical protein
MGKLFEVNWPEIFLPVHSLVEARASERDGVLS